MLKTLSTVAVALLCGAAHADDAPPATYALVVGSNPGGPGQETLRYAEDDARRMGKLLVELGGYRATDVDIVVRPTPEQLRERLAKLAARVAADHAAGRQSRVFFYYSGHARATAIDLIPSTGSGQPSTGSGGSAQLPLAELRQRLFNANAALTVVVLDACQSGAFSRVKGATPAADFSFNSRSQLDAKGIAVLASSSDSELSQESEQLQGSYFTHHLLVGMRGAGDANRDGAVSVDEAYRYAYHQTLLATSATAVGGQHVSLEVDLKGHGEVPLAFPRAATAAIELPAALEGHAFVSLRGAAGKVVIAETHKSGGGAVRIAVPPGEYEVIVRRRDRLHRCAITASSTASIDLARCSSEAYVAATSKGDVIGGVATARRVERPLRIELGGRIGAERSDAFTRTLTDFGYDQEMLGVGTNVSLGVSRELAVTGLGSARVWVGGLVDHAQAPTWRRSTELEPLEFEWATTSLLATARALQPLGGTRFGVYAQLGAGLAIGRTQFSDAMNETTRETHLGPAISAGAGLSIDSVIFRGLAMSLGYELGYARAIANNFDEVHGSGGHRVGLGLSYSY